VVCPGVGSTDANAFRFTKKLTNDDLPTLERPTKTTWERGGREVGERGQGER
jgi:hypothetical protein